jgi:uncharacterized protein involved in outer membrane biogenesis
MWTFIKSIFYLCLTLLLLLVAVIVYLVFFVDPNQYNAEISKSIFRTRGRTLRIEGKMHWTFFPVIGLNANNIRLSNPPSFSAADFLSANNAEMSLTFLPLLKGRIQVGKITLNDLTLNLIKNAAGQTNWQFSKNAASTSEKALPYNPHSEHTPFIKLGLITIGKITLNNANINYIDEKQNKKISLNNLQLQSENIAPNKFFPLQANFVLITNKLSTPVNVILHANGLFNPEKLRLEALNVQTNQYLWQGWLEMNFQKKDLAAMNGHLVFTGKNGSFKGIDLYYYSDLADAIINKTTSTRTDTHQTPFESIQGTVDIRNGQVTNPDLLIQAQAVNASGKGTADLVTQQINYEISLQRMTSGTETKPRGPAIPIVVTGTFSDPHIRPDWTKLAVSQLKAQIKTEIEKYKDKIPEKIQQGLQNLLGN